MKEAKLTLAMTAGVCALTVLAGQSISPLSMTIAAETHPLTTIVSTGTAIDTATSWNTGVPNTTMTTTGSSFDVGITRIYPDFNKTDYALGEALDLAGGTFQFKVYETYDKVAFQEGGDSDIDVGTLDSYRYDFAGHEITFKLNTAEVNPDKPGTYPVYIDIYFDGKSYDFVEACYVTYHDYSVTTMTDKNGRLLDENGEVLIVNGTSAVMSGKAGQTTATTAPYQSITTYTTIKSSVDVSLQGTANIKVYFNSVRGVDTYGLDCEVFNVETGEVILQWNTADTDTVLIEDLPYSFKSFDLNERGDIVYALRISNLPENVVFADTNSREPLEIFGKSVLGISGGTNLYADVTLRNPDYVPDFHDTTGIPTVENAEYTTDTATHTDWMTAITSSKTAGTTATDREGRLLDENGEVLIINGTSAVMSGKQGTGGGNIYRGDVNCKDGVDISDAVLLARVLAQDSTAIITEEGKRNADVDFDGDLTSHDVISLLRILAKLID